MELYIITNAKKSLYSETSIFLWKYILWKYILYMYISSIVHVYKSWKNHNHFKKILHLSKPVIFEKFLDLKMFDLGNKFWTNVLKLLRIYTHS